MNRFAFALSFASLAVVVACSKKDKDAPAGAGTATATGAATATGTGAAKPTDTPPAGAAAPATGCALTGTLALKTPSPAAGCSQAPRFDSIGVTLDSSVPDGDSLSFAVSAEAIEEQNVWVRASGKPAPAGGSCAITLTLSDAGRADDDETYTFALEVPAAGGAVKGQVERVGVDDEGAECKKTAAVEGTFTPGSPGGMATAPGTPGAPTAGAAGLAGPFPSIDAYCASTTTTFQKDDCWSQMDDTDMCSCAAATKDDLAGSVTASGTGTHVKRAAIVRVADAASDYVKCSLAFELAAGWRVADRVFPCSGAPISHDGGIDLTISSFKLTTAGSTDTIALAWTQDDGRTKTKHTLTCTASAADAVTCSPASPPPK